MKNQHLSRYTPIKNDLHPYLNGLTACGDDCSIKKMNKKNNESPNHLTILLK